MRLLTHAHASSSGGSSDGSSDGDGTPLSAQEASYTGIFLVKLSFTEVCVCDDNTDQETG